MSVTIYHKKSGANNSPVNVSITDVYATTGSVTLKQTWSYYFDHNGSRRTGNQNCSLIITSATNNISMVQSMMMSNLNSPDVSTTVVSKMLILSNLNKKQYSQFNLPVGNYTIMLVPEQVKSSDIGVTIADQKPAPELSESNFSSLRIVYNANIVDESGASTNPNGPTISFNGSYGKDRVVFIDESMNLDKYKPEGSKHSNNIYTVNEDAVLISSEYQLLRNQNGRMTEQTSDVTEPGHYYSKYVLTDKYGIRKETGFNVFVFKVLKTQDLNLVGNMTSTHLAIYRKNVTSFVSTGSVNKYRPLFKDSNGNFNSELVLFADTESSCNISVNNESVVIENAPLVRVANLYVEESINKTFNDNGSASVSLSDVLTNTGLSLVSRYNLTLDNNQTKTSIDFDASVAIEGNMQRYQIGYNNSSLKTQVYLTTKNSSPTISTKSGVSVDVHNQQSLNQLQKSSFDEYFTAESKFGLKNKSVSLGEMSYSSSGLIMKIHGSVSDSFGNTSRSLNMIRLNNKQSLDFNVSLNGLVNYPDVKINNIRISNVSEDVFSSLENYPSPKVTVELGSQKMTGSETSTGLVQESGSIKLTESDLTELFTGKALNLSVSMGNRSRQVSLSKQNVSVSGIVPKVNSYTGRTSMEAISFNSNVSLAINQTIYKNISDSVGIKSVELTDSSGRSVGLRNFSGNVLSLHNDKLISELKMSDTVNRDGMHSYNLKVTNLVGGVTQKSFSFEVVNINKEIVENSAWGFVKYSNPTDGNMELMILEKTTSSSIDIKNNSTFSKLNSEILSPGKSMIKCLPSRISLTAEDNVITQINKCGDIEIWAKVGSATYKLKSICSDELRPSVIC